MNLTIDIGNTKIKLALFDRHNLVDFGSFLYGDESKILQWIQDRTFDKAILSSVQMEEHPLVRSIIHETHAIRFDYKQSLPIQLNYRTPQTLGHDRIASMCGAISLYPNTNLFIVSAGSCVTYDILDANSVFQGGNIAPGMYMRWRAMHEFTGKLPMVHHQDLEINKLIGQSTDEALQLGVLQGIVAEIDHYYSELSLKYTGLKLVITGGDAMVLKTFTKFAAIHQPHLVLIGLNQILDYI